MYISTIYMILLYQSSILSEYTWFYSIIYTQWSYMMLLCQWSIRRVEWKPPYFLVRATFCKLSRPSHLKMLVLKLFVFKCSLICCINTFFKNLATLGHKYNIWFSRLNFLIRVKLKFSMCHVLLNLWTAQNAQKISFFLPNISRTLDFNILFHGIH